MKKNKKKTNDQSRYAPAGLILSAIALLVLIGTLIFKGVSSAGLYTPTDPAVFENNIKNILLVSGVLILLGLAISALLDPERATKMLTGRQAQYGSNALVLFVAFLGILIALNVLVYQNPMKWDWMSVDLTEDKQNTFAPETLDVLKALPENVTATAYFSANQNQAEAQTLLNKFKSSSNGKFEYSFVDPDSNPVAAQQDGVTGDGKIVLKTKASKEIAAFASEEEITKALIRLMNPTKLTIYFLTGHGEHDIKNPSDTSFTKARETLEGKNYTVKTLNLLAEHIIPDDAQAVVIAGAINPITDEEIKTLDAYLAKGGALVVLADPTVNAQPSDTPDPIVEYLATKWGMKLDNNVIVDTLAVDSPFNADAYQYAQHPITEKMNGIGTKYPLVRSITVIPENAPQANPSAFVITTEKAWGEMDLNSLNGQVAFDPAADKIGPLNIAAVAEDPATSARVVVFGNSSFAVDANFAYQGNGDMFINTIDWSAEQENLINLTTKKPIDRQFTAPKDENGQPDNIKLIAIILTGLCLVPLVILIGGVYAWWKRRKG